MKPEYTIQVATPRDAAGIARVHVDTWRTTYKGIVPDSHLESLSYENREEVWEGILSETRLHYHMWVAKDTDGKVIGFSDGGKNRDSSLPFDGEIYAIYLRKEFQGKGIGKNLFLNSFEQLFRHGYSKAVVWVLEENPTAKFYKAMGGEPIGEKWEEIGGKRLKEIAYGWKDILATLRKFRHTTRHPSIKHYSDLQEEDIGNTYPGSDEQLSIGSPFARAMGLKRLGIHHELLPPGRRTSWPHAEEDEEECIYVLEGNPHVWIDGEIYQLNPGDGVAFPCGTGACHTFINNTVTDVRLLVIGEASKKASKIYYPLNPSRKEQVKDNWWHDIPKRNMGIHDGLPDRLRERIGQREIKFAFRRLTNNDLVLLHGWLNRPHIVEQWDGALDLPAVQNKFQTHISSKNVFGYLALLEGSPVGYVQAYDAVSVGDGWWPEAKAGTGGIDQFLANESDLGKGLGTKLVQQFTEYVFQTHRALQIITDPSPENRRAIRCYEKAGFRKVSVVDTPDGKALLMEKERGGI